jgi:hypothetical protein
MSTYRDCCCSSDFEAVQVIVMVITALAPSGGASAAEGPISIFELLLDSDLELLCWKHWK